MRKPRWRRHPAGSRFLDDLCEDRYEVGLTPPAHGGSMSFESAYAVGRSPVDPAHLLGTELEILQVRAEIPPPLGTGGLVCTLACPLGDDRRLSSLVSRLHSTQLPTRPTSSSPSGECLTGTANAGRWPLEAGYAAEVAARTAHRLAGPCRRARLPRRDAVEVDGRLPPSRRADLLDRRNPLVHLLDPLAVYLFVGHEHNL
jgi:hypothetical protein